MRTAHEHILGKFQTPVAKPKKFHTMPLPTHCDLCGDPFNTEHQPKNNPPVFIDGATKFGGRWGDLCPRCHSVHGIGLGTGKGQKYNAITGEKLEG